MTRGNSKAGSAIRAISSWALSLCLCAAILYALRNEQEKLLQIFSISPLSGLLLSLLCALVFIPAGFSRKLMAERLNIRLAFVDWYGLLMVTNLISLVVPARGDLAVSAIYLRKKYNLPYTHFISMLYGATILLAICLSITSSLCLAILALEGSTIDVRILVIVAAFGLLSFFLGWIPANLLKGNRWVMKRLRTALDGWNHLRADRVTLGRLAFLTQAGIALVALWMYATYRALGFEISILSAAIAGVMVQMSFFISITPGNLGVREALIGFTSQVLGLGFAEGVAVTLLQRAVSILVFACLGGLFSFSIIRSLSLLSDKGENV